MQILIAGCGYVGIALGAELVRRRHRVWGMRRDSSAAPQLRSAGIEPLIADLADAKSLPSDSRRYDWVVHCASASRGGPEQYRRVYLQGTRNLLNWLASAPPEKLIYTSSTSVYGQMDGSSVTERSSTEPAAETARILLEAERLLFEASRAAAVPAVILRLAGIYGPGRGYWLRQFLSDEARIEGRGMRLVNMIHVEDVVDAILLGLQRGRPGEIYNVVDDEPVTQRVLLEWLSARLSRPLPPSNPDTSAPRKRGDTNKAVANQKLKAELGWRPKYPTFRQGYATELARLGWPQT